MIECLHMSPRGDLPENTVVTVCADVEAFVSVQTPFSQLCPGGQFSTHVLLHFSSLFPRFTSCFTSLISSNQFPLILLGSFSSFQSLFALSPFPNSDSIEQVKPFGTPVRTLIFLFKNQPTFQNLSLRLTCIPAFGSQCTWRGKVSCLLLSPSNAR